MQTQLTRDEQTALQCLAELKRIKYPLSREQEALFAALRARAAQQQQRAS
jgi:hypothetical protein